MKEFHSLADENGEISKTDLIVHTKASKFWKGYMESKSKPGGLISKVECHLQLNKLLMNMDGDLFSLDNKNFLFIIGFVSKSYHVFENILERHIGIAKIRPLKNTKKYSHVVYFWYCFL